MVDRHVLLLLLSTICSMRLLNGHGIACEASEVLTMYLYTLHCAVCVSVDVDYSQDKAISGS